jgi:hypothetical protein
MKNRKFTGARTEATKQLKRIIVRKAEHS